MSEIQKCTIFHLKSKYMNRIEINKMKYSSLTILLIAILFIFGSCSRKAVFQQSSVVPAAHGDVKVKKDNNQNYRIDVEVSDLAEVEKVYSKNHAYIVWMETDDGDTQKLGQLISSKGLFSNQRNAQLETVSTDEPVRIFITAERDKNARYPNNKMILRTKNF